MHITSFLSLLVVLIVSLEGVHHYRDHLSNFRYFLLSIKKSGTGNDADATLISSWVQVFQGAPACPHPPLWSGLTVTVSWISHGAEDFDQAR